MKTKWIDYSVGEREAHYRVYVGPTLSETLTEELRAIGLRANASTSNVYVVVPNLPNSRAAVLAAIRQFCSCVTDRDIIVLK